MGLFGLFRSGEEKKRKKLQEAEEKRTRCTAALQKARELKEQGQWQSALAQYEEACEGLAEAVLELADIFKAQGNAEAFFALCRKHGSDVFLDEEYLPVLKNLAQCYKDGEGTARNRTEAYTLMERYQRRKAGGSEDVSLELFMADCAKGICEDSEALHKDSFLASQPQYADVIEIEKTEYRKQLEKWSSRAKKHFKRAAELGSAPAMLECAKIYTKVPEMVLGYYNKAFDAGEYGAAALAFWRFNNFYYQNLMPENFDIFKLGMQLSKGTDQGDADCMFAYGLCFADGFIASYGGHGGYKKFDPPYPSDSEKFFRYLKEADAAGCSHPGVKVMLAEYYATGKIWKDSHYDEAPIYVQSQREVDLQKAYAMIEEVYGVLKKAFLADVLDLSSHFWYTKAKTLLGLMYFDGRGTEPSIHMAKVCLNCDGGENSISIPEDQAKSFEALRKALAEA